MSKSFLLLPLLWLLAACNQAAENTLLLENSLPAEKSAYQKRIVGQLSGHFNLADQTRIASRWSAEERAQAKKYLLELISSLQIEALTHNYTAANSNPAIDLILNPFKGSNIYGLLPATTDSKEYVVLGAHYDSGMQYAPGAIDNATGIALIYSVVKELTALPVRSRNVVLVFFDQEEEEQVGSTAFGQFMLDQHWEVHSLHCFDMVGWDADKDRAMEVYSASESLLAEYRQAFNDQNTPLKEIVIDPVGYQNDGTDFDIFVPMGFNVIGAGECYYHRDSTPYKDSEADTFETVDFDYLLSCSNLVYEVIKKTVE